MGRSLYRTTSIIRDATTGALTIIALPTCTIYESGTTTPIAPSRLFSAATGSGTLPNPFTGSADGTVEFWMADAEPVKIVATSGLRTVTLDDERPVLDPKNPTVNGTLTFTGTGKVVSAIAETLPASYGNGSTDYVRAAFGDGTSASPTASVIPSVRVHRISTPVAPSAAYVYGLFEVSSEVKGIITGALGNGGAFNYYAGIFSNYSRATGVQHSVYGLLADARAVPGTNASAGVSAILALAYCGPRGGQVFEPDLINNSGGAAPAISVDATSPPQYNGTTVPIGATAAVNILVQAGWSQIDTITITNGDPGDTYFIGVNGINTPATIAWDASAATVQTALENLSNVVPGDVVVTQSVVGSTVTNTLYWGGVFTRTAVTVTSTGTGCTATRAVALASDPSSGTSAGVIYQATAGGEVEHGHKPFPGFVKGGGYFFDGSGLAGTIGGTAYSARFGRVAPGDSIWALTQARNADFKLLGTDASDRALVRNFLYVAADKVGVGAAAATNPFEVTGAMSASGAGSFSSLNANTTGAAAGEVKTSSHVKAGATVFPTGQTAAGLSGASVVNLAASGTQPLIVTSGLVYLYDVTTGHIAVVGVAGLQTTISAVYTSSAPTWNVATTAGGSVWAAYLNSGVLTVQNRTGAQRSCYALILGN